MSPLAGRVRVMALALLAVVVLPSCDATDVDPTPTTSPQSTIDAAAVLSQIDCGAGLTDGIARPSEMVVLQDGVRVPDEAPPDPLPRADVDEVRPAALTDATTPVAAVQCAAVHVLGDGYAGFARRVYVGDLEQLAATLRTAQHPAPNERACPDIIDRAPNLWLVTDDGALMAPAWPADGCGHFTRPTPESVLTERALAPIDPESITPLP